VAPRGSIFISLFRLDGGETSGKSKYYILDFLCFVSISFVHSPLLATGRGNDYKQSFLFLFLFFSLCFYFWGGDLGAYHTSLVIGVWMSLAST